MSGFALPTRADYAARLGRLPLAGRRVLLAEDVAVCRLALTFAFEQAGAEVTGVADGTEAVDAWRTTRAAGERPFDVAVLDHGMPGLDGAETACALGAAGFPGAIVGLTAGVDPDEAARWRRVGCRFVLPKSLGEAALVARLAAVPRRPS